MFESLEHFLLRVTERELRVISHKVRGYHCAITLTSVTQRMDSTVHGINH